MGGIDFKHRNVTNMLVLRVGYFRGYLDSEKNSVKINDADDDDDDDDDGWHEFQVRKKNISYGI